MTVRVPPRTETQARGVKRQESLSHGRGISVVLAILAVIGIFHVLIMIGIEGYRAYRTRETVMQLEGRVGALEREHETLRVVIEHGDDPLYREQLARSLGYIFPNEIRVVTHPNNR